MPNLQTIPIPYGNQYVVLPGIFVVSGVQLDMYVYLSVEEIPVRQDQNFTYKYKKIILHCTYMYMYMEIKQ